MTPTDRIITYLNGAVVQANMGQWANVTGILHIVLDEIERVRRDEKENLACAA